MPITSRTMRRNTEGHMAKKATKKTATKVVKKPTKTSKKKAA